MVKKRIWNCARIWVVGLAAALLLLFLAYCLPTQPMKEHLRESVAVFEKEGTYPMFYGTMAARFSNFIECDWLLYAVHPVDDPWHDMMRNPKFVIEGKDPVETLMALESDQPADYRVYPRARYWHGYLIFLKPLLLLLNYAELRIFNLVLGCLLFVLLIFLLLRRGLSWRYAAAWTAAVLMLYPSIILRQIAWSAMFFIMEIGLIILIWKFDWLRKYTRMFCYFFLIGMLTSFIDFLTFPMISLGALLVMFLSLSPEENWRTSVRNVILFSLAWGIGYLGFWAAKWLAGTIILKENVFLEAWNEINMRTETIGLDGQPISRLSALIENLALFKTPFQIAVGGSYILMSLVFIVKNHPTAYRMLTVGIPYFLTAMIPIVWILATSNHAYIHNYFTYRNLFVLIIAFFVFLAQCGEQVKIRDVSETTI